MARFNRLATHYAGLAEVHQGQLRETYRAIAAAYRVMAISVRIELWWPVSARRSGARGRLIAPPAEER